MWFHVEETTSTKAGAAAMNPDHLTNSDPTIAANLG
jgi:hypothetical protein